MDFKEQTILISGGAGYFGQFLCDYCVSNGAKKVLLLDLDEKGLEVVKLKYPQIEIYPCDLTDFGAVKQTFSTISSVHKVTVVINNAGWIHSEPLVNLLNRDNPTHSFENWDKTIKSNLYTCFNLTSQAANAMVKARTKGVIISISSIAAGGNIGQTAYAAAKAGIEAMTKTWSKELGAFRIRTAAIAPGFIDTPSTNTSLSEQVLDRWKKQIPLGVLGGLNHIGQTVKFIVENDYINGKVISVDGGLTI